MRDRPTRLVPAASPPGSFSQAHQALFAGTSEWDAPDTRRIDTRARALAPAAAEDIMEAELLAFGRCSDTLDGGDY